MPPLGPREHLKFVRPALSWALKKRIPAISSGAPLPILEECGRLGWREEITLVDFVFFTSCCKLVTTPQNATLALSQRPCKKTCMKPTLRDAYQHHSGRG